MTCDKSTLPFLSSPLSLFFYLSLPASRDLFWRLPCFWVILNLIILKPLTSITNIPWFRVISIIIDICIISTWCESPIYVSTLTAFLLEVFIILDFDDVLSTFKVIDFASLLFFFPSVEPQDHGILHQVDTIKIILMSNDQGLSHSSGKALTNLVLECSASYPSPTNEKLLSKIRNFVIYISIRFSSVLASNCSYSWIKRVLLFVLIDSVPWH